jgi:glycosyltransferase involved in cell wall biosynthesis
LTLRHNKENPIVSVLLSAFNGDAFIQEQIVSIVKQNFNRFNIILRDDGSKNTNYGFIKNISNKYNISILVDDKNDENIGSVKSYNRLLGQSQSDYICFSDQDDVWKKDKLFHSFKRMKDLEKEHGSHTPILVHTDLSVCDNHLQKVHPSFITYQKLDPSKKSLHYLLLQNNVTGCTMMINRALKEKSFPIPEDACVHDWWIALVASSFGIIDFISIPTVKYRQHDKNQIGARKYGIHHFINRLKNIDSLIDEFHASILQATALYQRYKNSLNDEQKKIILAFINLEKKNIIERKITILRYKFFKQDFFRTIGLIGLV